MVSVGVRREKNILGLKGEERIVVAFPILPPPNSKFF